MTNKGEGMRRLPFDEPDWAAAPPWAAWWAVDKDGLPYWYAERPEPGKGAWWNEIGSQRQRVQPIGRLCRLDMTGVNWRETLRERDGNTNG